MACLNSLLDGSFGSEIIDENSFLQQPSYWNNNATPHQFDLDARCTDFALLDFSLFFSSNFWALFPFCTSKD